VSLPTAGRYLHELELAIVIGEDCRNVSRGRASEVIAGFTCFNDITNFERTNSIDPTVLGLRTNSFDNCAPVGPIVASPDLVPADARMELRVNGELRQETRRSNRIFSDDELIEEISKYVALKPGDIVATGAPAGAEELTDGDSVAIEIEGIGELRHTVRANS
jgi:2-keto-4-pentenoate hydratase/2-oxohepta-3-ene-1,7-dioic acid hydratase in catechol pathway